MRYNVLTKVSNEFIKWLTYAEKERLTSVGDNYENPGSYLGGAGDNNYTIFAKLYKQYTGIDVQGQPWCDTFIDTIFIHLFGVEIAKKLLGGFSAYTPTSANMFKSIGRWTTGEPEEGYIGFFKNSERIYHTFYVLSYKNGIMTTIEGNTGGLTGVVENGGCVAKKTYKYSDYKSKISGFGMPDYSLVEEYQEGWLRAADGIRWWYQRKDGSYPFNKWCTINRHYYLFDKQGYMLSGWQKWNRDTKEVNPSDGSGKWYFLETNQNEVEGACYHETILRDGSQEVWTIDLPNDI